MRVVVLAIALLICNLSLMAQADRWWTQYHYIGTPDIEKGSVWLDGGFDMNSNRLSNVITGSILSGNTVTSNKTSYLTEESSASKTTIGGGVDAAAWFRTDGDGALHWYFGASMTDRAYARFATGLVQLMLNGNGPYEDRSLDLGPSWLRYISAQSIGFGIDLESDNVIFGSNLNLIKVSRWQSIDVASGTFYTAPYGTRIEADLTASRMYTATSQSKPGAWYGTGASVGLFIINRTAPGKLLISAQIKDLGFVHFGGITEESIVLDTVFTGIRANDLLEAGPTFSEGNGLDSLEGLLGMQRSQESGAVLFPGSIQLDAVQPIGDKLSLAVQLRQYFMGVPPSMRLGMRIRLSNWLALEPYGSTGAFTRFDTGLGASVHPGERIQMNILYGLLESQIARATTRSQHLSGSFQFLF